LIRHRHRIVVALLCSPALWAAHVSGAITSSTKQSTSPAVIEPAVRDFISGELVRLQNKATQKGAKDALIAESTGRGDITATPEYQQTYAHVLSQQLQGLTKNPILNVRLCAGVVATQVAEQTLKVNGPAEFDALAAALIKDKDEAVVLWGVKLAKFVIGDLAIQGKNTDALGNAVIAAVKGRPNSGAIAEEAYAAFSLEPYQSADGFAKAAPVLLDHLLKLMDERTDQYATSPPPSPEAERTAAVYLAVQAAQAASAPPMRNRVLKSLGKAVCAVLGQIAAGNNTQQLVEVARSEGQALQVFGHNIPNPALETAGQAIATVSPNTPSNTLTANCTNLATALKGMGIPFSPPAGQSGTDTSGVQPVADQSAGAK